MCAGDIAIEPRGMNGQRGPIDLDTAFNGSHGTSKISLHKPTYLLWFIKYWSLNSM